MEYPSIGIPCIIAGDAFCSGKDFTIEPKSIEEYFYCLENIDKINYLDKEQIYKARLFFTLYNKIIKVNLKLFSPKKDKSQEEFWKELKKNLENYNEQDDIFLRSLKRQIDKKMRHLVNYEFF